MSLTKPDLVLRIKTWLGAWDAHDLDGVMELMHEDVIFENWTGQVIKSKQALRRAWTPWFLKHGNFKFTAEDIFVDEPEQKALFRWQLEWPSLESTHVGKREVRHGVDVLHFQNGKIREKLTYSKTTILIDDKPVRLQSEN